MPELPEVQTVVDTLSPRILGRSIARVDLRRSDIVDPAGIDLPQLITGRTVTSLTRRGKRIVFTLDDGNLFYIHLGMTGRLTIETPDAAIRKHTHLILSLNPEPRTLTPLELRFVDPRRFGGIWWCGKDAPKDTMGPEPLTITANELATRLKKTHRPIKNALMDQRVIAGLGNIYVDESLHAAGIHPLTFADRLKPAQVARLTKCIKSVLNKAIRHRGSTLRDYLDGEGKAGQFQKLHRVYARDGEPCLNCSTLIKRIVLGGRSTCFCPTCQRR